MPTTPELAVFIATSLDGSIARADGSLDWLDAAAEGAGDTGYDAFMASIDAIAVGRATYETALGFDPWPHAGRRVLVVSSTLATDGDPRIEVVRDLDALLDRLVAGGVRRAYVDGGRLVQSLLRRGLVDDLTITTVPVLLGNGIPLFGDLPGDRRFEHVATRVLGAGLVQSTYRSAR